MATTDMTLALEKIERSSSHLRRNSTGNFDVVHTASKVVPHYLQASSHSCHDYCKYGNMINTYETKAKNPFAPRFSVTPNKTHHHLAGTPNVVQRNRKPVITPKPSRDGKTHIQLSKSEAVKKEAPRSSKKVDTFQKQASEQKKYDLKPLQTKPSSLSSSKSVLRRHSDIIIPTKGLGGKEMCPLGSPSSRRNIEMGTVKFINSPKTSKKSQLAITVSTSPKARVKNVLNKNGGNLNSPRKVSSIITKQKSLRKVGPTKQSVVEEDVPEKTLYVIEPSVEKRSNISLPSPKSDKEGSKSPVRKEDRETNLLDEKAENKRRPVKVGRMTSDDGECSPRKLKFRMGKVVNVGMESSSSPRKLKFRPGKVLTESQKGSDGKADETKVGRRLRRLISDGEFDSNNIAESPKVVLRHQDVEGRKDEGGLFNNVIEETASKLVETRKSKVKALVGAFESLISIQDTKPSVTK